MVLRPDFAAHQFDQLAADRQAQAQARAAMLPRDAGIALGEALEQPAAVRLRQARTAIDHLNAQALAGRACLHQTDPDGAPVRELYGVAHQVQQDLPQPQPVDLPLRAWEVIDDLQVHALDRGLGGEDFAYLFGQCEDVGRLKFKLNLSSLQLGDVENVVDQGQQGFTGDGDAPDMALRRLRQDRLLQEGGEAEYAGERRAQFMAHIGQEGALGLDGGLDPALKRALGGDVSVHADQLGRPPLGVAHDSGGAFQPEHRARPGLDRVGPLHQFPREGGIEVRGVRVEQPGQACSRFVLVFNRQQIDEPAPNEFLGRVAEDLA